VVGLAYGDLLDHGDVDVRQLTVERAAIDFKEDLCQQEGRAFVVVRL
jgi:hypothetical protein